MNALIKPLVPELNATGLPWEAIKGGHHLKIFIANRLVASVPMKGSAKDTSNNRAFLNVRAQIRRAARQLQ